jgi:enoyl-CoA hydratase/carnithine racemase
MGEGIVMTEHVLVERHDRVLSVTWNRPEKKNALTGAMYTAFDEALAEAAADPAIRAVLVKGAGSAFTAGNDLQDFATWGRSASLEDLPVMRTIRRVLDFPKPLVAAVHGAAVGYGTTLLLHCDAVVAAPSATFSLPFIRLGLVPEFGSSLLLPAIAGNARASQKLLLGEPFGRDEALQMGLVSAACEEAELAERGLALCQQLAALPPGTVRTVKSLLHPADQKARLKATVEEELRLFAAALKSPEHQEAVKAFMEKRAPDFSQFS